MTGVWGVPQASPTAARGAAQGQRGGQGPGGSLWPRGWRCLSVHDAALGSVPGGWSQSVQMGHQEAKFRYLLLLPGAGGGDPLCSPRVGARGDGWDGGGEGEAPAPPWEGLGLGRLALDACHGGGGDLAPPRPSPLMPQPKGGCKRSWGTKESDTAQVRHHFFIKTHNLIFFTLKSHSKIGKETPQGVSRWEGRVSRPSRWGRTRDTTHGSATGTRGHAAGEVAPCGWWH